jgi:hypothetical protein
MQRIGSSRVARVSGTVPVPKAKVVAKPAAKPVAKAAPAPAKKVQPICFREWSFIKLMFSRC